MTVEELATWRAAKTPHLLLDVREDDELRTVALDGAVHLPMGSVVQRLDEIPRDVPIVVMCHKGGRSARVVGYLAGQGYGQVHNLDGGIDAYAARVDPSLARY